jgi:hypothetical protein
MRQKITFLLLAVFTTVLSAQTVNILGDPYGGNPYANISAAITAATDGDVILITGVHTESISFGKSITLRGTDPTTDIIQAAATASTDGTGSRVIYLGTGSYSITIENLGIRHGNVTGPGGGIFADKTKTSVTLNNLVIENNYATTTGGGVNLTGVITGTINNCTIQNNTAGSSGGGLTIVPNNNTAANSNYLVDNSLFTGNSALNGGAINVNGNKDFGDDYKIDATIQNSTIFNNSATSGTSGSGGGAIWAKAAIWTDDGSSTNTTLTLIHVTMDINSHTSAAKNGLSFTGDVDVDFEAYNSILINGTGTAQRAINFVNVNTVEVINCILGGLNSAPTGFLDTPAKNNVRGKKTGFAGLASSLSDEGGKTSVLTIGTNNNTDDYCTAATGITLPTTDQRGFLRNASPSAGAFEYYNIWNGTDSDWTNATNWADGVPIAGDLAQIKSASNMPTASIAIDVTNMIMDAGTSFITSSTFAGNLSYTRNLSTDNWYTVSSPVVGETYGDDFVTSNGIASSGENRAIAPYVTSNDSWAYMQAGDESTTFISGKGYSVKLASPGAISFTGTMNVDDTSIALTTSGEGFNLIGNPYPSYINSGSILPNSTSALDAETLWVWNQEDETYDTYVTVDAFKIAPGQGFFVKSGGAEGSVLIAEADQSHQSTDTFQRTEAKPEIYLTLIDGSASREAKIYFIDNTTTGFDNGYDGEMFGGVANDFAIYTHLVSNSQGKDYAIQSLPRDNYINIPVGVNAISGTAITIEASTTNFPEGMNIYLEDTSDNSFTLLDAESDFTTTLGSDLNGIGRFYLHTTTGALSTNDVAANNNLSIYTSTRENLRIVGVQNGTANIQLYNILGKEVLKGSFEGNGVNDIALPRLNSGIYIVKIATEKGTINKKIIIQ